MAYSTTQIKSLVTTYAGVFGIPPAVALCVAQQESGFSQSAVSSTGAIGVMQLMPATAATLGVDPYDTEQNIIGGCSYLSQMYARFGDWDLALAAYNAGPATVDKYGGIPPITETRNYVSSILSCVSASGDVAGDTLLASSGSSGSTGSLDTTQIALYAGLAVAAFFLLDAASG